VQTELQHAGVRRIALAEGNNIMRKRALLTGSMSLFLGLAPAALLSSTASAASSDGAQHIHSEGCPTEFLCTIIDGVANGTSNGNLVTFFFHLDQAITFDDGTCRRVVNSSTSQHVVTRLNEDASQLVTVKSAVISFESGCGNPPRNCTITDHFVFANGEVRLTDFEMNCTPA
jgi:hypothetical protein